MADVSMSGDTPRTDERWEERADEASRSELLGMVRSLRGELLQTEKERDEFKDFWENATDLAAEARAEMDVVQEERRANLRRAIKAEAEVERLGAIEEAAKVIDALAQQRSCSLYEVAHESWPGQFGQLHRALTTQEDR